MVVFHGRSTGTDVDARNDQALRGRDVRGAIGHGQRCEMSARHADGHRDPSDSASGSTALALKRERHTWTLTPLVELRLGILTMHVSVSRGLFIFPDTFRSAIKIVW